MEMFEAFLNSIPKSRSEMVEELEIPEITVPPYIWDPDSLATHDVLAAQSDVMAKHSEALATHSDLLATHSDIMSTRSNSLASTSTDSCKVRSYSTDSSIPLSRAMTDSDIDYERFRRYKSRSISNPWEQMRMAMDAFPPEYLESLKKFQTSSEEVVQQAPGPRPARRHEELAQKMRRFFQEECQAFAPDDPGLPEMQEALASVDMRKILEAERLESKKLRST